MKGPVFYALIGILFWVIGHGALWAATPNGFALIVVNKQSGEPVGRAEVELTAGDNEPQEFVSDLEGRVSLPISTGPTSSKIRVIARKAGFAPMKMEWSSGRQLPATFELMLPEAETVGGRVIDEENNPVAGAKVRLVVPRRLAPPHLATKDMVVKTDVDGVWTCGSVPKDPAYVQVEVSHPDYESTGAGNLSLAELKREEAKVRLTATTQVQGQVLNPDGKPAADAVVWLGQGLDIDFELKPRSLPEIAVANPSSDHRVRAAAVFQRDEARKGDSVDLVVKARIASGHYIYGLNDSGTSALPTSIKLENPLSWLEAEGPWQGPAPNIKDNGARSYSKQVLFRRRFHIARSPGDTTSKVAVKLTFQVCNDAVCWPAEELTLNPEITTMP